MLVMGGGVHSGCQLDQHPSVHHLFDEVQWTAQGRADGLNMLAGSFPVPVHSTPSPTHTSHQYHAVLLAESCTHEKTSGTIGGEGDRPFFYCESTLSDQSNLKRDIDRAAYPLYTLCA